MDTKIKVAILQNYLDRFCDRNKTENPFTCEDVKFQTALLYLKCMNLSKNFEPFYVDLSYEPDNQMDILPFPFVVSQIYYNRSNLVTTPYLISSYKFFVAKLFDDSAETVADWSYLIDAFRSPTWITVVFILVFFKIIKELATHMSKKWFNKKMLAVESFQILRFSSSIFLALMLGLYASNLKALVTVQVKPIPPFSSMEELTKSVRTGKKTLINDSFNVSYVWKVLSGQSLVNDEYPEKLKKLYEATASNPSLEISMKEVCDRLKSDTSLVFVGRQSDLEEQCPDDCFWTVDIPEIPTVFRSFLFPTESRKYDEEANLCVTFLQNVRQRQIQKKRKLFFPNCDRYLANQTIKMTTFLAPIWIWLGGLLIAMVVFIVEKFSCLFRIKSKQIKTHDIEF